MTTLLFLLIFFVAAAFSMVGLGGGIVYVPILLQSGFTFSQAASVSLAIIVVMSITATVIYHRANLVDWVMLAILEPFSVLGAVTAGLTSSIFHVKTLQILFAVVSLFSAFFMLRQPRTPEFFNHGKLGFIHRKMGQDRYDINLWLGIPLTFMAGYVSVLLGIGGGFAKVPMMTLIFGVPSKIAVATSSAMIVITAASGVATYGFSGHVDYRIVALLGLSALIGAYTGSKMSVKADKKFVNMFFSVLLVLISIWMLYQALH